MLPTIHFIHPWFLSKTGHNMPDKPLYRNMLPQWFQVNVFLVWALHMTNHFIEGKLAFNQEAFAAAISLYSKRNCGKPFYRGWAWTGPVYTGGGARNAVAKPFYRAQMLANHFIKDIPAFWDHLNAQKTEMNPGHSLFEGVQGVSL